MQKVIVFGGSGFLGSHVADELSQRGYAVTIFDIRESPYIRFDQKMIVGNILDKEKVLEAIASSDIVYNFAGLADINEAKERPELTAQLNILGNVNILEGVRIHNVKRFVFASTVYVYSESGSFYRVSKQASENFIELYQEKYGIPFTILRYGSLYGRRAGSSNGLYRFIYSALKNSEITYQGSGNELREYIHVMDAASLSVDILKDEFVNKHLVVTGIQSMRVNDMIAMIREILCDKVSVKFDNSNVDAHYHITPYTYKPKLGKKIVANPFVDIGQGILDCIHEISDSLNLNLKKSKCET